MNSVLQSEQKFTRTSRSSLLKTSCLFSAMRSTRSLKVTQKLLTAQKKRKGGAKKVSAKAEARIKQPSRPPPRMYKKKDAECRPRRCFSGFVPFKRFGFFSGLKGSKSTSGSSKVLSWRHLHLLSLYAYDCHVLMISDRHQEGCRVQLFFDLRL